jgi:hypothetical protein
MSILKQAGQNKWLNSYKVCEIRIAEVEFKLLWECKDKKE